MKKSTITFGWLAGAVIALGGIWSCTKSFEDTTTPAQQELSNQSIVQVYMAMVNANRNYVYMDGGQITGSLMTSGSVFPSTGSYGAVVPGGLRSFLIRDTLSTSTQVPLVFAQNLSAAKNYTIFVYDTINAPRQKTVLTNITIPSDSTARIRFAHFPYNPTAMPNVDVFSFRRNANLFTNVAFTDVTDFIPCQPNVIDTLYVREAGTTNQLVKVPFGPLTSKRSYTAIFRGSYRATTRTVSIFANY